MTSTHFSRARSKRRDYRALALLSIVVAVLVLGYLVQHLPMGKAVDAKPDTPPPHPELIEYRRGVAADAQPGSARPFQGEADPREDPLAHIKEAQQNEVHNRFVQALAMLHAGRWDNAIVALHRLLQLDPSRPEAYTNLGFAYLGKEDYQLALDFFNDSLNLDPGQANAYFGAAVAYEGLGDLAAAMSGMRSFLHLVDEPDPNQIHIAQARSALWEWEAKLGRGPWGPTQGIPPGLTEEQIRRDGEGAGKGIGVMMPVEPVEGRDDTWRFEVQYGDQIPGQFKQ